jgi:hypothetical protein
MMSYEIDEYEVNNYSDASMVIINDSISSTGLTLELYYYGEDEGMTGNWYSIFVYENGEWNNVPWIIDEIAWTMIGIIVYNNKAKEIEVNWETWYGELSAGRYLIVKQFMNHRGPGDYDEYHLGCEFTI